MINKPNFVVISRLSIMLKFVYLFETTMAKALTELY
jgi:hypothetical protein